MSPKFVRDPRSLTIYIVTVFAFALYGLVLQTTVSKVESNTETLAQQRLESCLGGIAILQTFNEQQRTLIEITANREDLSPSVKERYVTAYANAIVRPLPTCTQERQRLKDEKEKNE